MSERYSRTNWQPSDACYLRPVRILAADGVTELGMISVTELIARAKAAEKVKASRAQSIAPRSFDIPTVPRLRRTMARRKYEPRD